MQFEFTATVDKVNCHIRAYGSQVVPKEVVDQRPHKHYFMEFHCVFAGEETVLLPESKQELRLTPGQILLIPKNVYHGVTTRNDVVERLCFNFSADSEAAKNSAIIELYRTVTQPLVEEDPEIYSVLKQCRQWKQETGFFAVEQQGLRLLNAVLQMLNRVAGDRKPQTTDNTHALRQKWIIEDYIEQYFTDHTGLEGLAQKLFLSQRQTRKLVQQFLGEDFKSILIRRRMELAEIYLRDPEKTLEEIAWQVGYRSYSGFQLCFKKYFGITPSQYRQQ